MDTPDRQPGKDSDELLAAGRPATWSKPVGRLKVEETPAGATNLNVDGRQVSGPLQGFGQLWQKTFRVRLAGARVTPAEVLKVWRENFSLFHTQDNRFYSGPAGIKPGEVLLLNADTPGGPVSTGMLGLYADDYSFTLITPEGHPESGWVTFSASEEEGVTVAQVQTLARANDPFYELAFMAAGTAVQDQTWETVLTSLAAYFGVKGAVTMRKELVDARRQWSRAGNLWKNAMIRTIFYKLAAPLRWLRGKR